MWTFWEKNLDEGAALMDAAAKKYTLDLHQDLFQASLEPEAMLLDVDADHPIQEEHPTMSAFQISWVILKKGGPMALSFTFTFSQIATAILAARQYLNDPDSKESDPDRYLAASALITAFMNCCASLSLSPLYAMSILGSHEEGKLSRAGISVDNKDNIHEKIANIFKAGNALSLIILPLPIAALYFSKDILVHVFNQDERVAILAGENLTASAFAMPGMILRLCNEQMLFSFGKSLAAMLISLPCFAIGTGLAYYLSSGSPKLGLAGISYGYVVESYLTYLGFLLYLKKDEAFKNIPLFKPFISRQDFFKQLKKILKIGLPITGQVSFELAFGLAIGVFAGWLGVDQLAAQDLSTQLFVFTIIPSIAFGQTVAQEVSRVLGKGDYHLASNFSRYGLLTTVGIIAGINIPMAAIPRAISSIFSIDIGDRALYFAEHILPATATATIYDAASSCMINTSRSVGDLNYPGFIKIVSFCLGMVIAYTLGFFTDYDLYGINIGFLLGTAFAAMFMFPRWLMNTSEEELKFQAQKSEKFLPALGLFANSSIQISQEDTSDLEMTMRIS